jgi:hypothetical protein
MAKRLCPPSSGYERNALKLARSPVLFASSASNRSAEDVPVSSVRAA